MSGKVRPTKKQRQLLSYIQEFIAENGYSPSYREIMKGCDYTSVATVSLHVNNLIKRGHLQKRDNSARSLEVVDGVDEEPKMKTNQVSESDGKWLVKKVEQFFEEAENSQPTKEQVDNLYVMVGALKVLGIEGAAQSFIPRLTKLKDRGHK